MLGNIILCVLGSCLTIYLASCGQRTPTKVNFIVSGFISGAFFFSQVSPYFDPKMRLFGVLLTVVVLAGALVGGVVGILLPKISTGLSLGVLLSLFVGVIIHGSSLGSDKYAITCTAATFALLVAGSIYATQVFELTSSSLRTSLATGLALAMSIDFVLEKALIESISAVLQMKSFDLGQADCFAECHVPTLLGVWAVGAFATWIMQNILSGQMKRWSQRRYTHAYQSLLAPKNQTECKSSASQQRTFSYPDALEFNFFDPDMLPEMMQPYAEVVFSTVQSLAKQYGFQVDNSRNQAEHLLMMLANESSPTDSNLSGAVERVHSKMLRNYRKWCDRMGTPPLFSTQSNRKAYASTVEDLLVYLLVWGEAANLKHLPECLCFLYHKTMQEHIINSSRGVSPSTYPGYFLDMVVTPIYEVIAASLKKSEDNEFKKTYDDFNEFFWSPSCMRYRIHDTADDSEAGGGGSCGSDDHVSVGMQNATKTYLEKRSWLHPLLSVHRVFEWHTISFTLLMAWAFSNQLVWTYAFTFQVASFIFWEITFLGILWTCLEVWTVFPNASISGPSICGFLIRLMAGYLVLIYQSIYYHWSFRSDILSSSGEPMSSEECNFWWWQYVWLSLMASSVYFLESFLCWMPSAVSSLLSYNNDVVQALLNICYPTSQLYVGKKIDVPLREAANYILYWLTLIAFKLWFGYRYIINPVSEPSIQLYDFYMNYPDMAFYKTASLMFVWWFPHFLVYLIDLSIWYSCWSSLVGGFVALVDRQGAVRDSRSFRAHFMRSPMAFCQKIMPISSDVGARSSVGVYPSTASLSGLMAIGRDIPTPNPTSIPSTPPSGRHPKKAVSSADLRSNLFAPSEAATPTSNRTSRDSESGKGWSEFGDGTSYQTISESNLGKVPHSSESVTDFLDVRSQRWVVFGRVWNEIVLKLRDTDHLSDVEKENLLFSTFDWLSKPIYLPLFQTAGCVETSMYALKEAASLYLEEKEPQRKLLVLDSYYEGLDITSKEAVSELWELLSWLFERLLGPVHQVDVGKLITVVGNWAGSDDIFIRLNPDGIPALASYASNVVRALKGCIGARKKNPVVTPDVIKRSNEAARNAPSIKLPTPSMEVASTGKKIKKSVSTGFLSALEGGDSINGTIGDVSSSTDSSSTTSKRYTKLQPFRQPVQFSDNVRDKVKEDMRNLLNSLRNLLKVKSGVDSEGKDLIDRVTFILSMESGFLWNDVYASMQIDELARDMRAPSVLNKANGLLQLRQTQVDPASSEANRRLNFFINSLFMDMPNVPSSRWAKEYTCMTPYYSEDVLLTKADLESKNSDGVSTILYLQTLYKKDWLNFLERRGLSDDTLIWSVKHLQETRMWASLRAQTLFRTVDGMMHSEAATRLLAELESTSFAEIDVLAKLKFNYVVACQVYGQMRKNLEHKADDIEFLLARHPNLRVAYIDNVRTNREGDQAYYSVLIKHDPSGDTARTMAVQEVYRIKLPGNPVLGEGKPENQNHAIIFSRGRYLQAIDMNQDGYFEESLKMRNLLQEFDSGCSILGFREHIFTGSVSSVANYMALQELSFVSLGQRVLAQPLRIRQHYGHPDLFDKFFVMTEGGMSKASHGINLSEDVFAGFNATIRGHTINFKEYVQVGKGRDVGLQQMYKFEAKLSQGNAEQSLSRDIYRICDRLDFFRLMSFYYGGIGHYIANTMVMFTLVVVVYTMLGLAVYGQEGINGKRMTPEGLLQLLLGGMGLLQTMPLMVTLTVEKGFLKAMSEIAWMFLSGGPLYFIFQIQTKCYYFQQTLLAGGAKYRPTGRGFVIRHSPFDENYRFFASSHIYIGFEIMVALILFAMYTTSIQYWGLTWSLWLTVVSFVLGPFWFNPVTFEWNKIQEDYTQWIRWMMESGGTAEQSWEVWWKEENSFFKGLSVSWKVTLIVQKCCLWLLIGAGIAGSRLFRDSGEQQKVLELIALSCLFIFFNWCISKLERSFSYAVRRFSSLTLSTGFIGITAYLFVSHTLYVKYTIALYYVMSSISFLCLLLGFAPVAYLYKMHDYIVGHSIFSMIGILSAFQIGYMQTWLLYHNALSSGVAIEDILKHARKTKEMAGDEVSSIAELKAQLAEQEKTIKMLVLSRGVVASNSDVEMSERSALISPGQQSAKASSGGASIPSVPGPKKASYGSAGSGSGLNIGISLTDKTVKSAVGSIFGNGSYSDQSEYKSGDVNTVRAPSALKKDSPKVLPVSILSPLQPHNVTANNDEREGGRVRDYENHNGRGSDRSDRLAAATVAALGESTNGLKITSKVSMATPPNSAKSDADVRNRSNMPSSATHSSPSPNSNSISNPTDFVFAQPTTFPSRDSPRK